MSVGRRKKTNAGASSMDRFRMMRRAEMRANWRDWLGIVIACACAVAAILFGDGWLRVGAAWFLGAFMTLAFVGWTIGGHVSSLTWLWGAAAERDTAEELAKLPDGWAQIHDVDNGRGNPVGDPYEGAGYAAATASGSFYQLIGQAVNPGDTFCASGRFSSYTSSGGSGGRGDDSGC